MKYPRFLSVLLFVFVSAAIGINADRTEMSWYWPAGELSIGQCIR